MTAKMPAKISGGTVAISFCFYVVGRLAGPAMVTRRRQRALARVASGGVVLGLAGLDDV